MKKSIIWIAAIVLIVLLPILNFWLVQNDALAYSIPSASCQWLFRCSPREFIDNEHAFYEKIGYFWEESYVDWDDNLVLIFSRKNFELFVESEWLNSFEEIEDKPNIELSSDLKSITFYTYPETYDEDSDCVRAVLMKLATAQRFDGISEEDVCIHLTEIDAMTGEVTFSEDIKINPSFE